MTVEGRTDSGNPGAPVFLAGGGEMGALMRAADWSATPLGPAASWPDPLRTVVRLMLNTRHPMFVFWGPAHTCLYNDAYSASIGPERHPGALGQPGRAVWAEIWDVIGPQIEQVMAGGSATWHENQLLPITRHGRVDDVYWTYSYSPIDQQSAATGVGGVLVLCSETTAQVMAERRLAEHAATTTAERDRLWRNSRDLLLVSETDGRFRAVNPAWTVVLGWSAAELVGREQLDFIHPADHMPSRDALGRAGSPDGLLAYETRMLHKDGSYRWISWVAAPGDGAIYAGGRHITAEKAAVEALERSEARLRALFETNYQLQALVALDGTLLDVNATALAAIGVDRDAVVGGAFCDAPWFSTTPDLPEKVRRALASAADGNSVRQEVCVNLPSGTRLLDFSMRPVRDRHGAVIAVVPEAVDITERRQVEAALRQSQKMEAVGQLTGGIAHDFNNMLQGVASGIELARRRIARGQADEAPRFLDAAQEAVDRAAALTRRLLAFGRRQSLNPRPVLLNELITGMGDLIRQTVGPSIAVETQLQDGCWPVRCDANQLENALLNLAINARDAMLPHEGRLLIRTAHAVLDKAAAAGWDGALPGDYVRLTVADTGTGMTPEVLARAFEPFFTTKPDGQGTGLGLSQIYGFVRQSDGFSRIESTPGNGSSIHLYLPRALAG